MMNEALPMNIAYSGIAILIVYELAFIIRQCRDKELYATWGLRVSAVAVGTILIFKSLSRLSSADPAQWLDLAREGSWALFLLSAIFLLKINRGWW